MKMKLWIAGALSLLVLLPLKAQEVSYALPSTTLVVKVEFQQEQFFAGPYAPFAKRMLNIDVRGDDAVTCSLLSAEIVPLVEADANAWYTCPEENASLLTLSAQGLVSLGNQSLPVQWRFPARTGADYTHAGLSAEKKTVTRIEYRETISEEGDTLRVPVEHKMLTDKSLEDKAAEAADMILSIRQDRLNIASGNTDASFSGEAMRAAIEELNRAEREYLALFRGYSVRRSGVATFEVIPDAQTRRYLAFRLTGDGPVPDGVKGVPYYIELEPEQALEEEDKDRRKSKNPVIRYRIPMVCRISLTQDGKQLIRTRIPVYQLGRESTYPLVK